VTTAVSTTNVANYGPVTVITVTASPFVWQNPENVPVNVVISIGTVTAIEFSVDNATWLNFGLLGGQFHLNPKQWIRVTYAVAPTMNYIPI
jgi:hypothetical protein